MAGFSKEQNAAIKLLVKEVFQSEHDNEMVKGLLKDTLEGGLLKNTLEEGLLKEVLQDDFEIRKTPRFKAANGGVQITDLPSVNQFGSGDLMLVRKTAQGQDSSIVYDNFLNSIGNTAIGGFVATVDPQNANGIILNPVNGVGIPAYVNNMKISFVSPITSTGQVQVKIGTLTYNKLYAYNSTTTSVLKTGDYVEAVLINGSPDNAFYQTNNANYVYTNDYVVSDFTYDGGGIATTIYLTTAYGVAKTSYYDGMTINFTCPKNTQGFVRVKIDALSLLDLTPDIDGGIPLQLFANQMVQAVYSATSVSFIPNTFYTLDPTVEVPILPDPEKPNEPIIPPQNEHTFFVGTIGKNDFPNLQKAIGSLISKYTKDGGGRQVTLIITSDLNLSENSLNLNDMDVSWITLKSSSNNVIKIIDDITNPQSGHHIFTTHSCRGFFNFEKDTIIIHDANNKASQVCFLSTSASKFKIKDIAINTININPSGQHFTFFLQWENQITFDNVTLNGGQVLLNMFSQKSTISLETCRFNNYLTNSILIDSPNSELSIQNCDLSKNGSSAKSDIQINTFCSITQINSKAQSNYPANTNNNNCRYSVVGDQKTFQKQN